MVAVHVDVLTTVNTNRESGIAAGDNVKEWAFDQSVLFEIDPARATNAQPFFNADAQRARADAAEERTQSIINGDFEAASEISESGEDEAAGDLNQADVALTALQCFLVYNIGAFSRQHKDLLSTGKPSTGYKKRL